MTELTLTRSYQPTAALGSMIGLVRVSELFTIELPWDNNQPDKSCVPEGIYALVPYESPTHGPTWYLSNQALRVGGTGALRSFCELHAANFARQLLGCIAAGLESTPMFDPDTGIVTPAIESSRTAIGELLAELGPMSFGHTLKITSPNGPPLVT